MKNDKMKEFSNYELRQELLDRVEDAKRKLKEAEEETKKAEEKVEARRKELEQYEKKQ